MGTDVVIVDGQSLTIDHVIAVARHGTQVRLESSAREKIRAACEFVQELIREGTVAYGVTTGVGMLSDVTISNEKARELQHNLLRSHACGVGPPFPEEVVRAACLLRANALALGLSGVRPIIVDTLVDLLNKGVTPVVPEQGSLGASGDLAPLAHLALVLIGEGEAKVGNKVLSGAEALQYAGIEPLVLTAKEGLALINGTQIMSGLGALAVRDCFVLVNVADMAGALTMEALHGITDAFDARIHLARPHPGQMVTAENMRCLLSGSKMTSRSGELRIQDPYGMRCIPQVHGASRDAFTYVREVIGRELNSATDNPLLFPDEKDVLSGGNFHGQPLAISLDFLAIAVAELASIAERRLERLLNPSLSGLPPFLTPSAGLSSGLMITQYTAAALVSENKILASPASVDSIPTSANQEDHVSMGAIAARKVRHVIDNVWHVLAFELIAAAQALDLQPRKQLGRGTIGVYDLVRSVLPTITDDRSLSGEVADLVHCLRDGQLVSEMKKDGILND